MREIAVRGFINEKFNTTFGKGLFRRAVYNGSVELHKPNQKYLVDYYSYPEWEAQAKSDGQIAAINHLANSGVTEDKEMLFSWLVHYDPLTKSKERKLQCPRKLRYIRKRFALQEPSDGR